MTTIDPPAAVRVHAGVRMGGQGGGGATLLKALIHNSSKSVHYFNTYSTHYSSPFFVLLMLMELMIALANENSQPRFVHQETFHI